MEVWLTWIPLASLVVAGLAVFFGPLITLKIARGERRTSMLVANKQIVAPMRQAWIDKLRDKVADVLSTAHWYYVSGEDPEHQDAGAGNRVERRLLFQVQEIELLLNLAEPDHRELLATLQQLAGSCYAGSDTHTEFPRLHETAGAVCRRVLKREWNRVKAEIAEDPSGEIEVPGGSLDDRAALPEGSPGAEEGGVEPHSA